MKVNFSLKIHSMDTLILFMMILHNLMDSMNGKMIFIQVINLHKKMINLMINLMIILPILKMTKATTALTVRDLEIMEDQDGVDENLKKISEEE